MALTVNMPQLGESVTEGTIARWLKQPGEPVAKYESIAEVITDKVNAEIPAPADGTMGELIAQEGAVVAVGEPIATIDTGDGAQQAPQEAAGAAAPASHSPRPPSPQPTAASTRDASPQPATASGASSEEAAGAAAPASPPEAAGAAASASHSPRPPSPQPASASAADASPQAAATSASDAPPQSGPAPSSGGTNGGGDGYHLTPAVRMLVREHGVDLGQIEGSGIGGRITKKDVLDFVQRRDSGQLQSAAAQQQGAQTAAQQPQRATQPYAAPQPQAAQQQPAAQQQQLEPVATPSVATVTGGDTLVPLTSARKAIADHMVRSKHTAPHAYLMMEVNMSRISQARDAAKGEFQQRYGIKLTFLPFVARAVCEALRRHPTLNAVWSDEGIVLKRDVHLGIAVALEENLVVPVVRNADRLNIAGLATSMADLGERARQNRLKLDEIQGGTFTLNNTGALGAVMTQAIINQPQAAIMTMDLVVKRPVVVGDAIAIRPMMNLGMSFDHRINDGLQATRFVKTVKELLEGFDAGSPLL